MKMNGVTTYNPVVDKTLNSYGNTGESKKMTDIQQPESEQTKEVPHDKLEQAIKAANEMMKMSDTRFEYSVDKDINREVVKLINNQTDEVIRQYPPAEILNMVTKMYNMFGIIVDKKL